MIQFTPKTDEMLDIDEMTLEQLQTYKEDLLRFFLQEFLLWEK